MPALREPPPSAGTGSSPTGAVVAGEQRRLLSSGADVTGEKEERRSAEEAPDEFAADAADPAAGREGDLGEGSPAGEVAATEVEPIEGAEPAVEEPILADEAATIEDEPTVIHEEPTTIADESTTTDEPPLAGEPTVEDAPESAEQPHDPAIAGTEGARLIALNMALNGTPRNETARYLSENFNLEDQDAVLEEVYSRVGS